MLVTDQDRVNFSVSQQNSGELTSISVDQSQSIANAPRRVPVHMSVWF